MLKKLAIVSAISLVSAGAFAMEAVDDVALSNTTGQAGLTITTNLNISGATLTYTDTDGFGTSYNKSGDLNVRGLGITGTGIVTKIDVGGNGTTAALNLEVDLPVLTITVGSIDVCNTPVSGQCAAPSKSNVLLLPTGGLTITTTAQVMNVQLGDKTTPQGHMAVLTDSSAMSITLGNGSANQIVVADPNNGTASSTPGIGIGKMVLSGLDMGTSFSGGNYTSVDATTAGLVMKFNGNAMSSVGVALTNVSLGETCAGIASGCTASPSIGNVTISGLNMSGTSVTISGH